MSTNKSQIQRNVNRWKSSSKVDASLQYLGRSDEGKMSGYRKELQKNATVVAGGRGFEPRLTESESVVLPLDDPPIFVSVSRVR